MRGDNHKDKKKSFEKKKNYNKKSKHFAKKKSNTKRSFVVGTQEWVTDVSSSEDEDIVGVAITNHEIPLPPPLMCLMAKGNSKVSDGESDKSNDEIDPNEFSNLIHEYICIIKSEKCKVKKIESAHASLESSHNDLLVKYNALLKEHDESLNQLKLSRLMLLLLMMTCLKNLFIQPLRKVLLTPLLRMHLVALRVRKSGPI
jgi:hypothetical protein